MKISKELEAIGYFWDPQHPDYLVPGTLRVQTSGRSVVSLFGRFEGVVNSLIGKGCPTTVLGRLEDGRSVTLDQCRYGSGIIRLMSGLSTSDLLCATLFIHQPIEPGLDGKLTKVRFSVEGLDEWLGISGIKVTNTLAPMRTVIDFTAPGDISIPLSSDMELSFRFDSTHPVGEITEAKVTQAAYAYLELKDGKPFEYFAEIIRQLANFFTLAAGQSVGLTSVAAFIKGVYPDDKERSRESLVDVYYESVTSGHSSRAVNGNRLLFGYQQVSKNLAEILRSWLKAYDRYEPALNLYFAAVGEGNRYLEGRFLSLSQALETLHRRTSSVTNMPADEYAGLASTLLGACPPDHRAWLEGRLRYANEMPLRKRLKELFGQFNRLFGDNAGKLAGFITDTRNYYTHYDAALTAKAAEGKQLWGLCRKLECLIQLHLLKTIGLLDEEIDHVVAANATMRESIYLKV